MKIGSTVELIDDSWNIPLKQMSQEYNTVYPVKGKKYKIRSVVEEGGVVGITLEEIRNPKVEWKSGYHELRFAIWRFRELMPPMSKAEDEMMEQALEELMEEVLIA